MPGVPLVSRVRLGSGVPAVAEVTLVVLAVIYVVVFGACCMFVYTAVSLVSWNLFLK